MCDDGRHLDKLPEFNDLSKFVLDSAYEYFTFNGIPQENVRIVMSWANVYPKGSFIRPHDHSTFESLTSAVFCVEEGHSLLHIKTMSKPYKINKGELIIFPSHLEHWTTPNTSDKERVIVGFDIYFGKKSDEEIIKKLSQFGG